MAMPAKGLDGVVATDTALSDVDGAAGRLIFCGYDIMDLGRYATYEEVAYLLWYGDLPDRQQLSDFKAALAAQRELPTAVINILRRIPPTAHPMAVLRTLTSYLGTLDPTADDVRRAAVRDKALRLTAVTPTIIAAWERIRSGQDPIPPRRDLGHAANFLSMLSGREPHPDAVRAVDAYLVLLADHSLNASTFAVRVTTGTGADFYSAITTGIGTLKGAAHGGANQKAMEQFIDAAQRGDVAVWYAEARAACRRIMGMGHRVYKVEDPRATILRPMARSLAASSGQGEWYRIAAAIEQLARQDPYFVQRNLYPNVDYYSAVVLYTVGIPVDQFTPLFAMSRVAGWSAHVLEQLADNRLIHPQAGYSGAHGRLFIPLDARG